MPNLAPVRGVNLHEAGGAARPGNIPSLRRASSSSTREYPEPSQGSSSGPKAAVAPGKAAS